MQKPAAISSETVFAPSYKVIAKGLGWRVLEGYSRPIWILQIKGRTMAHAGSKRVLVLAMKRNGLHIPEAIHTLPDFFDGP